MDYVIFYYFKSAHAKSGTVVHACDSDSQQAGGKRIKTGYKRVPAYMHACAAWVCTCVWEYICMR